MTSSIPPPRGAGDKDVSDFAADNLNVRERIIKENEARKARNALRQSQREDSSYTNEVESDESLLDINPNQTDDSEHERSSTPPPHANEIDDILSTIMKLTPRSKKAVVLLCGDKSDKQDISSSYTTPKILFSSDNARPNPSRTARSYKVHPLLVQLAETNFHVPLTLFTSDVTDRLWKNSAILTMKKIMLLSGTKATIVDPAQFPDEDHISIAEFHEAYQNLLEFQKQYGDEKFFQRSLNHYQFLCSTSHFAQNFRAIRKFDKDIRQELAFDPKEFNKEIYLMKFERTKSEIFREEQREENDRLRRELGGGPDRSFSDKARDRSHPYADSSSTGKAGPSKDKPFPAGKNGSTAAVTCLICGRLGHRFTICTYTLTEKGTQVWAKWFEKSFTARISGNAICINWNIFGKCSKPHPNHHVCSVCGNAGHHASSRSCL